MNICIALLPTFHCYQRRGKRFRGQKIHGKSVDRISYCRKAELWNRGLQEGKMSYNKSVLKV